MLLYDVQYHGKACDSAIPLHSAIPEVGAVARCVNGDPTDLQVCGAQRLWMRISREEYDERFKRLLASKGGGA